MKKAKTAIAEPAIVIDLHARKLEAEADAEAKHDLLITTIGKVVREEFLGLTPEQHGLIATFVMARFDLYKALMGLRDEGHLEDWMILGIASQYFRDHITPMMKDRGAEEAAE